MQSTDVLPLGMAAIMTNHHDAASEFLARSTSRRKQSKPLRVFASKSDDVTNDNKTDQEIANQNQKSSFDSIRSVTPMETENSTDEDLNSSVSQNGESNSRHSFAANSNENDDSSSYLKQSSMECDSEGMLLNSVSNNNMDTSARSRIFHKDAFCELCNREFCNKYFLKTHKANKHGTVSKINVVQTLPIPNVGSNMGTNSYSNVNSVVNSSAGINAYNNVNIPTVFSMPSMPALSLPPASSMSATTSPAKFLSDSFEPKAVDIVSAARQSFLNSNMSPEDILLQSDRGRPSANTDMEDFCEFCQKHFCNKYYLRKHKLDVHGIFSEKNSNGRRCGPRMASFSMGGSVINSNPSTSSLSLPLLPPHSAAALSSIANALDPLNSSGVMPDMNALTNLMFLNPFAPPIALVQPPPLIGANSANILSGLPPLLPLPSMPSSQFDGAALFNDSRKRSENNAYCQLCRKEFYNDYFLNVHMLTKHSMPTSDLSKLITVDSVNKNKSADDATKQVSKEDKNIRYMCDICNKCFSGKSELQLHTLQCQPIKSEKNPEDMLQSSAMSLSEGEMSARQEASGLLTNFMTTRLIDRVVCDICNKEVCNKYFLKTHKQKVHGISVNTLVSTKDVTENPSNVTHSFMINGSASALSLCAGDSSSFHSLSEHPSAEDLLKLGIDPESYCEICKKEFSSKYFLKTHKLNIHGIRNGLETTKSFPTSMEKLALLGSQPTPATLGDVAEQVKITANTPEKSDMKYDARLVQNSLINSTASPAIAGSWNNSLGGSPLQQQRRVKCTHCDKELCNKYFLKAHMLNKHGISWSSNSSGAGLNGEDVWPASDNNSTSSIGLDLSVKGNKKVTAETNHEANNNNMNQENTKQNMPYASSMQKVLDYSINCSKPGNLSFQRNSYSRTKSLTLGAYNAVFRGSGSYWRKRYMNKKWHLLGKRMINSWKAQTDVNNLVSEVNRIAKLTMNGVSAKKEMGKDMAMSTKSGGSAIMQTFVMEPLASNNILEDGYELFSKAIVTVPVLREISRPVQVTFLVTPTCLENNYAARGITCIERTG